jgi:hypothetical protein
MATQTQLQDVRRHAGARWLASFLAVFLAALVIPVLMLVYPYITG